MASSVEVHRAAHEAFNARDFERMRSLTAETIAFADHPRGLRGNSFDHFVGYLGEWIQGMSDAQVAEPEYLDAGEHSVCRFTGRGTNDGPLGPAGAETGKTMALPFCEIVRVRDGRIVEVELFYDQLSLLTQLGLAEAETPA